MRAFSDLIERILQKDDPDSAKMLFDEVMLGRTLVLATGILIGNA